MRLPFYILLIAVVSWAHAPALAQPARAMPTNSVSTATSQARASTNIVKKVPARIHTSVTLVPPQGWRVATNLGCIYFHHPNESRPPFEDNTFIQFSPETDKSTTDIAKEWKEIESVDRDNAEEYKVLSKGTLKIQGLEAHDFVRYCAWGDHHQIFRDVLIVKSNQVIGFHLCTETNDYAVNNRVLNRVMESLVWK